LQLQPGRRAPGQSSSRPRDSSEIASLRSRPGQAGQAAIDVVEFVLGVGQVAPEHAEVPLHIGQVGREAGYALGDFPGVAFDGESAQRHGDRLQVGVEGVWRSRHHSSFPGVQGWRGGFVLASLLDNQLLKDVFGRYVHEGEIDRMLVRLDIMSHRVHMIANGAQEEASRSPTVFVGIGFDESSELGHRKLRIDRHELFADSNHRVHSGSVGKGVLQLVLPGPEHVSEEVFEH